MPSLSQVVNDPSCLHTPLFSWLGRTYGRIQVYLGQVDVVPVRIITAPVGPLTLPLICPPDSFWAGAQGFQVVPWLGEPRWTLTLGMQRGVRCFLSPGETRGLERDDKGDRTVLWWEHSCGFHPSLGYVRLLDEREQEVGVCRAGLPLHSPHRSPYEEQPTLPVGRLRKSGSVRQSLGVDRHSPRSPSKSTFW